MSKGFKIDIKRTVKESVRLPFDELARASLPNDYELSLVICGDKLAQRMNKEYRQKSYYPNVLSFELEKKAGEIFLNVRKAEREAIRHGVSLRERLALLFVHGCFHLSGHAHGRTMESAEKRVLRKFGF